MANIREEKRVVRLNSIKKILRSAASTKTAIDKEYLIADIMSVHGISRRVAKEDVEAMIMIIGMEEIKIDGKDTRL